MVEIDGTTRVGFQGSRVIVAIAQFLRWAIWAAVYWAVILVPGDGVEPATCGL